MVSARALRSFFSSLEVAKSASILNFLSTWGVASKIFWVPRSYYFCSIKTKGEVEF
jgi:hypothetical protein